VSSSLGDLLARARRAEVTSATVQLEVVQSTAVREEDVEFSVAEHVAMPEGRAQPEGAHAEGSGDSAPAFVIGGAVYAGLEESRAAEDRMTTFIENTQRDDEPEVTACVAYKVEEPMMHEASNHRSNDCQPLQAVTESSAASVSEARVQSTSRVGSCRKRR